ncbi:MAG: hypothetical protein AB7F98_15205, partial [Novosphingobium sp.]
GQQGHFIGETLEGTNIRSRAPAANALAVPHATDGAAESQTAGDTASGFGTPRKVPRKPRPRGGRRGH